METITKKNAKNKIESVEFQLDNGHNIVWRKSKVVKGSWDITKYIHGERAKNIHALHLPTIENALHFDAKL